jgi:gliding motility associated protien GldN
MIFRSIIFLFAGVVLIQPGHETYKGYYGVDKSLSWELQLENGMLNGTFKKYTFDQVVLEGGLVNNLRNGEWKVYNNKGVQCLSLRYEKGILVKVSQAKNEKGEDLPAPKILPVSLKKDEHGLIPWKKINEAEVEWSKRVWRKLEPCEVNKCFFGDNKFFGHLFKQIHSGKLKAYDTTSEEFTEQITPEKWKSIIPAGNFDVVAWIVKEDYFYRKGSQQVEVKQVGICPVIEEKKDNKIIVRKLFWLYYPDVRKTLATFAVSFSDDNRIAHTDDVFYFRHFAGQIYKEGNVYDREISAYAKGSEIKNEACRIEVDIINIERDLWLEKLGYKK